MHNKYFNVPLLFGWERTYTQIGEVVRNSALYWNVILEMEVYTFFFNLKNLWEKKTLINVEHFFYHYTIKTQSIIVINVIMLCNVILCFIRKYKNIFKLCFLTEWIIHWKHLYYLLTWIIISDVGSLHAHLTRNKKNILAIWKTRYKHTFSMEHQVFNVVSGTNVLNFSSQTPHTELRYFLHRTIGLLGLSSQQTKFIWNLQIGSFQSKEIKTN